MIHAISLLLDDQGQPSRKLDRVQSLAAAYELVAAAIDEMALANERPRSAARTLLIRAHVVNHFRQSDPHDVLEFLRGLVAELSEELTPDPPGEDPTDWDKAALK